MEVNRFPDFRRDAYSISPVSSLVVNLQGDIVSLIDNTGTEVVKYVYDAWGQILSTSGSLASTLGTIQPFRYRGYVFDQETGLYYLRSRYYIPIWHRFINPDSFNMAGINVKNMYFYCQCNPIMFIDPNGNIERYHDAVPIYHKRTTEWYFRIDNEEGIEIHIHLYEIHKRRVVNEYCVTASGKQHHTDIPLPNKRALEAMQSGDRVTMHWPPKKDHNDDSNDNNNNNYSDGSSDKILPSRKKKTMQSNNGYSNCTIPAIPIDVSSYPKAAYFPNVNSTVPACNIRFNSICVPSVQILVDQFIGGNDDAFYVCFAQ